jgi:hypothetical protein
MVKLASERLVVQWRFKTLKCILQFIFSEPVISKSWQSKWWGSGSKFCNYFLAKFVNFFFNSNKSKSQSIVFNEVLMRIYPILGKPFLYLLYLKSYSEKRHKYKYCGAYWLLFKHSQWGHYFKSSLHWDTFALNWLLLAYPSDM